jgi:pimeloyl-ACP methyl ester carboxylesterase
MPSFSQLHARDVGQGEPVLALHGLMASQRVFDAVIARGQDNHRFLAVDLPRSGRSGAWGSMRPSELADLLVGWLETKGVRRAIVAGHSYGGLIGLAMAENHPKVVSRLVVMSTPALGVPAEAKALFNMPYAEQAAGMLGRLPTVKLVLKNYLRNFLAGDPKKFDDAWLDGYLDTLSSEGAWLAMLEAVRHVGDYRLPVEALKSKGIDTRVLWGDRDRLVPLVQGEQLARALNAPFTVLHRTGHLVPEEQPDAVLAAIDGN